MMNGALKGMVTLVTGGASGLGRATAERFLKQGSKIVICDMPTSKGAELAKELGDRDAIFCPTDVRRERDVTAALEQSKEKFGKLEVVVNCAGIFVSTPVYDFNKKQSHSLEDFQRIIDVNTVGTFNVIRLAVGLIGENVPNENGQRGVILNTASIAAFGIGEQAAYSASKAAVVGMTLPLARALSVRGIRVCTIAPGLFETPILAKAPKQNRKRLAAAVPFPSRPGLPSEFAQLAEALVLNPMMNGATVRIDGAIRT